MLIRVCKCNHRRTSHITMATPGPCQECDCTGWDDSGNYIETTEPKEEPT